MKWIFNPAIRLGNQLSFKYKFLLWSCLMLLPLAYSMTNLLGRLHDDNVGPTASWREWPISPPCPLSSKPCSPIAIW